MMKHHENKSAVSCQKLKQGNNFLADIGGIRFVDKEIIPLCPLLFSRCFHHDYDYNDQIILYKVSEKNYTYLYY